MKWCKHCEINKPETAFKDREDGWGLYDWCNECRLNEGRDRLTVRQWRFMAKTQFFFLRDEPCQIAVIQTPLLAKQ